MKMRTLWLTATICVVFSLRAGAAAAENASLATASTAVSSPTREGTQSGAAESTGKKEKAAKEDETPSLHETPREIPQQKAAFDDLAERAAKAGERPRMGRVSRAMSAEDLKEGQAKPTKRPPKSFTYEDIEEKRRKMEKATPEAMRSLEDAKRFILKMSDKQPAKKGWKAGNILYVFMGVAVLAFVAGAAFFVWKFALNK